MLSVGTDCAYGEGVRDLHMKTTAVIVAAGAGKRMNSTVKKQYMEIGGYPVLYYTIRAFEMSDTDEIVIVTGADETEYVKKEIVDKHMFRKVVCVCAGGKERSDSVYEGLCRVREGYVLIHDGVRMLITPDLINKCIIIVCHPFNCQIFYFFIMFLSIE